MNSVLRYLFPLLPGPGTEEWKVYYAAKANANPGFDVRCDRKLDDGIMALAEKEGYGASSRSPGYMHLRPNQMEEKTVV